MRLITREYFFNKLDTKELSKLYIESVSDKIYFEKNICLSVMDKWESVCYFELNSGKVFILDYNLDSILYPSKYSITEEEVLSENLDLSDWSLIKISDKLSHSLNILHMSYSNTLHRRDFDEELYKKFLKLEDGTWKLENKRINESIVFSIKLESLFKESEMILYIGIDELGIYPMKEVEVRNKIYFITNLIKWRI